LQSHLERAYTIVDPEFACDLYDEWAGKYEADLSDGKFIGPQLAAQFAREYGKINAQSRVLDMCAGTGLVTYLCIFQLKTIILGVTLFT
jgi:hypothetical protein